MLSFISSGLPGLIDTLLHSCQLEAFFMNAFDAGIKVLDTEIFPQHAIADLNSGIAFIAIHSTYTVKGNKHTQTHMLATKAANSHKFKYPLGFQNYLGFLRTSV